MGSIRYRGRNAPQPVPFGDALDDLRDGFRDRLDQERLQLLSLGAALVSSEGGCARVLDDLIFRAQRLRGRAQVLEIDAVAQAANALERAATEASAPGTLRGDPAIQNALDALVHLISTIAAISIARPNAHNG